jgi:ABC-2 type transport system ATP-binding protein
VSGVVVEDLVVSYGDLRAVDHASFTAVQGEVTVILGPNGAGKTSTIEVCEGFRTATSGNVTVSGLHPLRDHAALTRKMGVMLQGGGVYPSSRVSEVVRLYVDLYDKGASADELVDRVGLGHRRDHTWKRLSGGEQQRLSLALALAAVPEVAFLDEPTAGVDVSGRQDIRRIVTDLAATGCAVVLATHELDEAERLADRIVIFHHGRVVANGTLADLRRGNDGLRFTSSPELDPGALSRHLGAEVTRGADGLVLVSADPTTSLIARLSQWLADHSLPLNDLRTSETLEAIFQRIIDATGDGR